MVINLTITFFWAAWKLTLCLYLLDRCAQTPHYTQQLDQNQPEKLLEDQKRVGTHSMAASPTSNTSESDVRFWIHSGRMCISMWKNDLSDFFSYFCVSDLTVGRKQRFNNFHEIFPSAFFFLMVSMALQLFYRASSVSFKNMDVILIFQNKGIDQIHQYVYSFWERTII